MVIKLSQNMDANQVSELKDQFLVAFNSGGGAYVDVSFVENLSTPLIQLLFLARQHAKDNEYSFSFQHASEAFITMIKDFGCEKHFEGTFQ